MTKKSSSRKNKSYVSIRMDKETHAMLKKRAQAEGRTLSNYCVHFLTQVYHTLDK